jgi:hypothetical protein
MNYCAIIVAFIAFIIVIKFILFLIHLLFLKKTPVIQAQSAVYNSQTGIEKVSTIGGTLIDENGTKYGLGTCHGLKQKFVESQELFMNERAQLILNKKDDSILGRLTYVVFNEKFDMALVRIDGRRKMDSTIDNSAIGNPKKVYKLTQSDENTLKVVLLSDVQGGSVIEGIVTSINATAEVTLTGDGVIVNKMIHLIKISALDKDKNFTENGDSGAWVRTKDTNEVVGVVIGGDKNETYLMNMNNILADWAIRLDMAITILNKENDEKEPI